MRVQEESGKAALKLNIKKKVKIMASGPITSRQIEGGKVETGTDFLFLGSKITVDGDCSQEIRIGLLLGKKTMIMASSPITSWQTDRETMETVTDFIFLGSKITADGDCSLEI